MSQVHAATQPGTLGSYDLSERLGIGGLGEVWRAYDRARGVEVAVKILAGDRAASAAAWAALEREHAVAGMLHHPGILQVQPPERIEGRAVLPMELADGGDLAELRGRGYLHIVPVLLEVAAALQYAHERGVVHRDLKPGNILFDRRGRVKLADFGSAAVLSHGRADPAGAAGGEMSPFSASPEQLRGEPARPADDIYGLGAVAYDLLAGRPPYFPHFDAARIQAGPVPRLVPLQPAPVRLINLILWMLAARAENRPTLPQVTDELEASLNTTSALDPAKDFARRPTQRVPVERPVDVEPEPSIAVEPEPSLAAEPEPSLAAEPAPMSVDDDLSLTLDEFPQDRGLSVARYGEPPRPRRLRYLLVGLVCGAALGVGALQWLSRQGLTGSPLHVLSATLFGAPIERPPVDPVRRAGPRPIVRPAPSPPSGLAALGRLVAQRAGFNQQLSFLAARGASTWDAADFAAARAEALDTSRAEEVGDIAATRRHWRLAERSLAELEREAPRALAAELAAGRSALAAGHRGAAARAFALARRIDPANRRAVAGERQIRLLAALAPLMSDARRAEQAHDYARAARDVRQVLARDPGYAAAKAALAQVHAAFARAGYAKAERAGVAAFAGGRLFQAQADFQQALVFRSHGIEATKGLEEVNAALRERAALP